MPPKLTNLILDFLIGLGGFITGMVAFYSVRGRFFTKGLSGPEFVHTMNNVNKLLIEQNREIAKLSADLTAAQFQINRLVEEKASQALKIEVLESRGRYLAQEVERLTLLSGK